MLQDCNLLQVHLVLLIAGASGSVSAMGDDDQVGVVLLWFASSPCLMMS